MRSGKRSSSSCRLRMETARARGGGGPTPRSNLRKTSSRGARRPSTRGRATRLRRGLSWCCSRTSARRRRSPRLVERGSQGSPTYVFDWFVHSEVAGSIVLLASTIAAMLLANSAWADLYFRLNHVEIGMSVGSRTLTLSLQHWVNDGLMALFFFVVGLEIKRELLVDHLSS